MAHANTVEFVGDNNSTFPIVR